MSLSALVVLTSVVASPVVGQMPAGDVFSAIDRRYERATIDAETRHLYRVAAVRRPGLLPAGLRDLAVGTGGIRRRSLTPIFVEAMRWVQRNNAQGGALHRLLMPPDDMAIVIESATHPIRVSYATAADQAFAEWCLQYAEISWDVLVLQYGFWEPPIEPGSEDYRIYVDSTNGSGAAYTAPYDENPATPHTDYFTYIVVDPASNDEWNISGTMAHEMNHATQAAMDVLEPAPFWENTATYIQSRVFPDQLSFTVGTMYLFQTQPWRALDYMNQQNSDAYEYGGGLFVWYLADTYAPNDPPQFVAEIWQNSVQEDTVNEPDYFDAIEETVAARGFPHTMEEILLDFSEARFFVGDQDDGEHIYGAWQFDNAGVTLARHHLQSHLPVIGGSPPEVAKPASFGSNHVLADLSTSAQDPVLVQFDGDDDTRWAVRVLLTGGGQATESADLPLAPNTWDGSMVVQPAGHDSLLMVVANLGQQGYDPDTYSSWTGWPVSNYTYTIEPLPDPPADLVLEPAVVERDQGNVSFVLRGTGFRAGGEFALEFVDPNIYIVSIDSVLLEQVTFHLAIPMLTELGAKELIVTNGDGRQTSAPGILTVVEAGSIVPDGGPGSGDSPKAGCGCRSAESAPNTALGFGVCALFALLLLRLKRRR